jgi:hypothetical protein
MLLFIPEVSGSNKGQNTTSQHAYLSLSLYLKAKGAEHELTANFQAHCKSQCIFVDF